MKEYRITRSGFRLHPDRSVEQVGAVQAEALEQQGLEIGVRLLDPRFDLCNHSPTGFEYGYHGSGPSQLALAICADALGDDERALRVYQEFKRLYVATRPQWDPWQMTEDQVLHAVRSIEARVA